jgi:ABC-2 type transport system ATP-binding protein
VDTLCDRLAILVSGRVRAEGSPDQLKQQMGGGYKVSLKLGAADGLEEADQLLAGMPGLVFLGQRQKWLSYRVTGAVSSVLGLLAAARGQGRLEGFTINMTSLDDIFLEVTSDGKDGQPGSPALEPGAGEEQPYDPLAGGREATAISREAAVYVRPESAEEAEDKAEKGEAGAPLAGGGGALETTQPV